MAFSATPMVPGDLFESAAKLASACDARFARQAEPKDRAALLAATWQEVVALGWPSVAVPEACGGAGGTLRDVAALVEGGARAALALPLASALGVVPVLLDGIGTAGQDLLRGIAAGTHHVAAATDAIHGDAFGAGWAGDAPRLSGAVVGIDCPPALTHVLLACTIDGEDVLLAMARDDARLSFQAHERIDCRPTIDVRFDGNTPLAGNVLARGPAVGRAVQRAVRAGTLLACVEAVAAMGAALEQAIAYLKERVQFDAPLSSFQVLRHRVADLYAEQESARALVSDLIEQVAASPDWPERDIDLAKLHLGPASRRFAAAIIQLHGGMGMTEELAASRLAKRLLMVEFEYGDTAFHEARLLAAARAAA